MVFVHLIFLSFVSCLLTVTLHIVEMRLTCLINITYLLTCGEPSSILCSVQFFFSAPGLWKIH